MMEQIYAPIGPNWRDGYDIVNTIPWDPAATVVPGPDCLPSIDAGEGEFYYSVSELLGADNLQRCTATRRRTPSTLVGWPTVGSTVGSTAAFGCAWWCGLHFYDFSSFR